MSKKHQGVKVKFSPFVQQDMAVGRIQAFGRTATEKESVEEFLARGGKITECKAKIPKMYQ